MSKKKTNKVALRIMREKS